MTKLALEDCGGTDLVHRQIYDPGKYMAQAELSAKPKPSPWDGGVGQTSPASIFFSFFYFHQ